MSAYVDTSGLAKKLLAEPGSAEVVAEMARQRTSFTAVITYAEACAAIGRAERVGRISRGDLVGCMETLATTWPSLYRVAIDEGLVHRAGDLALQFGLRGYDAIHLAAALSVHQRDPLTFIAWDADLRAAAAASGLPVFPASL